MSFPIFEDDESIKADWKQALRPEFGNNENFYKILSEKIEKMYNTNGRAKSDSVYPRNRHDIFQAFKLTSFQNTRVVILGEEPYQSKAAHGLSFSVNPKANIADIPPSLKNIFNELENDNDVDFETPSTTCLKTWADQGVLLLNTRLTLGIKNLRWQKFIDAVIRILNDEHSKRVVFVFLGKKAVKKRKIIINAPEKHKILLASHPSDQGFKQNLTENGREIAKPFFNSHLFSKANNFLKEKGIPLIDWRL